MPASTTTARRNRAARTKLTPVPGASETPAAAPASEETPKPTLTAVPSETPKSRPKPEPKPLAQADLGARQVTYYFPQLTLSDGTVIACSHSKYGHEGEAASRRCLAQLAAQHGHRVS